MMFIRGNVGVGRKSGGVGGGREWELWAVRCCAPLSYCLLLTKALRKAFAIK
jgi:hypothetical protein